MRRPQPKRRAVASAIRLGAFKLIEIESDYSGRREASLLFDLESDPGELVDLAEREPEKLAALSAALGGASMRGSDEVRTEEATGLDVDVLRALGYVD